MRLLTALAVALALAAGVALVVLPRVVGWGGGAADRCRRAPRRHGAASPARGLRAGAG